MIDAIRDEYGELLGFAKITRDCTEQQAQQRKQQEQEQRFRLLVEGVTDYAIYMLDLDGNVENWNAGAQRQTTWPKKLSVSTSRASTAHRIA